MRRVFGAKKNTEPPPSIQDASDRVSPLVSNHSYLFYSVFLLQIVCNIMWRNKDLCNDLGNIDFF